MQDFRKLKVWEKAHQLALELYRVTRAFPAHERFGITDQMRRASMSIAANIVEGTARATDRDTARFLRISLASTAELQYHLLFVHDIGLLPDPAYSEFEQRTIEIKRMLSGFIRRLKADG